MLAKAGIYLDSNAGAPLGQKAREVLLSFLSGSSRGAADSSLLSNPSSVHSYGRAAKRLLAQAREQIAHSLGPRINPSDCILTSSGTEANQLAIRSFFEPKFMRGEKPHWITSKAEHDSVTQMVDWLQEQGGEVSFLPLDAHGLYDLSQIEKLWRPETSLVSLLWVNNETGVINDMPQAASLIQKCGGFFHIDAAQAWGKLPMDLNELGAHWVSFSGHKIGGPAGTGVLWAKKDPRLEAFTPLLRGKQESSRRGGTENLLGAILLGAVASDLNPASWANRVKPLRDRLEEALLAKIPGMKIHGQFAPRVANTLSLSLGEVPNDTLVAALDLAGFAVSQGSACSSGVTYASPVLMAMGVSAEEARSSIRISLVDLLPWEDLARLTDELCRIVSRQNERQKNF